MKKTLIMLIVATTFLAKASETKAETPVGGIIAFSGSEKKLKELLSDDWMLCNGDSVETRKYKDLYETIGSIYGKHPNPRYFYLPDYRGLFLRGVNENRSDSLSDPNTNSRIPSRSGGNAGNQVGSLQVDELKLHSHEVETGFNFMASANTTLLMRLIKSGTIDPNAGPSNIETIQKSGGSETRPKNTYVYWIIKVK